MESLFFFDNRGSPRQETLLLPSNGASKSLVVLCLGRLLGEYRYRESCFFIYDS